MLWVLYHHSFIHSLIYTIRSVLMVVLVADVDPGTFSFS